jgi:hypothetical protein
MLIPSRNGSAMGGGLVFGRLLLNLCVLQRFAANPAVPAPDNDQDSALLPVCLPHPQYAPPQAIANLAQARTPDVCDSSALRKIR